MAAPMEAGPEQDAQQAGPFMGPSTACQIPGCDRILEDNPRYYKKFRVCKYHANLLEYDGTRFCQQCGRFQPVDEFEGDRKSCRASLQKHNMRRRLKAAAKRASSSVTDTKGSPTAVTSAAAAPGGAAGSGAGYGPSSPQAEPPQVTSPAVTAALGQAPQPAAPAAPAQPLGDPVSIPQPSGSGSTMRITYPGPASPTSQPPSPAPPPSQALQQQQLSLPAAAHLQGLQHQQHVLQLLQQQWERQRHQRRQQQQQQQQQQQELLGLSLFGQEQLSPGMLVEQQLDLLTAQELENLAGRLAGHGSFPWAPDDRKQQQQQLADWAAAQQALGGYPAAASQQQLQHQRQAVQQGSPQQPAFPGGAAGGGLRLHADMTSDAATWLPSMGQQQLSRHHQPHHHHHEQQQHLQQELAPDVKAGFTVMEGDGASLESEQLAASWELLNEIRASSLHASMPGPHAPSLPPAGPYNAQGLPPPPPPQAQGAAAPPTRPETPFPMWLRDPSPVLGPPLRTLPLHSAAPPLPLLPLQQLGQGLATDPSLPGPSQPLHHQQQQQQQLPPASAPPGLHGQGWGPAPGAPGWEQVRPPLRLQQQQQQQQPHVVGPEQAGGVLEVLSQRVFGVAPHMLAPHVREAVVTLMAQDPDFVARVLSGMW